MGDNGRWFKLWCSSIGDPDLDSLDIADFGRWAKLGAYIKEHGSNGEITIVEPARLVVSMLQLPSFQSVFDTLKTFKNVTVSLVTNTPVSLHIKYENWHKYQGDFSSDRVRKHREKKGQNETPKKRGEEKRGEEKIPLPPYEEIIDFLNEQTGGHYKATSKDTREHIKARWDEGATLGDFKKAIANMTAVWKSDSKMAQYLRPATLFAKGKFEGYVNRILTKADRDKGFL